MVSEVKLKDYGAIWEQLHEQIYNKRLLNMTKSDIDTHRTPGSLVLDAQA